MVLVKISFNFGFSRASGDSRKRLTSTLASLSAAFHKYTNVFKLLKLGFIWHDSSRGVAHAEKKPI
jgi:hypothetical protein